MKKLMMATLLSTAASAVLFMSGCVSKVPATGMWMDNSVKPAKEGIAETRMCMFSPVAVMRTGFPTDGDVSISAAMRNGKITKVHHVDYEWDPRLENFPFVYFRTIVVGE